MMPIPLRLMMSVFLLSIPMSQGWAQGVRNRPVPVPPPAQGVIAIPVYPDLLPWCACPHPGWGIPGPIIIVSGVIEQQRLFEKTQRLWDQANFPIPESKTQPPPLTAQEHQQMGKTALADGRFGGAVHHFARAMQLEPLEPEPALQHALALVSLGQPRKAAETLQRALRLMPADTLSSIQPRQLYGPQSALFDKHLKDVEAAVAKTPDDEGLLILQAYLLWCDGQPNKAKKLLDRAVHLVFDPTILPRFAHR